MKLVEPYAKLYEEPDNLLKVATIARTCTGTEEKASHDTEGFCQRLLERGHGTPFEHVWVKADSFKVSEFLVGHDIYGMRDRWDRTGMTSINGRDFLAMGGALEELQKAPQCQGVYTFEIQCDIGLSRELIRHRQMSFMERSTRYCKEIAFIVPEKLNGFIGHELARISDTYEGLLRGNMEPQYARYILPLCTATKLYMTGTMSQWEEVLALRLGAGAHPEMKKLMVQVKAALDAKL